MDISAISGSSSSSQSVGSSNGDSTTQRLEKEKKELNKDINKELVSDDDEKTKDSKIKILQSRIQLIDMQIAAEELKKKNKQEKSAKDDEDPQQIQDALASALAAENSSVNLMA